MTYELLEKGIQEELLSLPKEFLPQILNYLRLLRKEYLSPKEHVTEQAAQGDFMDSLRIIAPSIYEARVANPQLFSEDDDFELFRYLK